MFWLNTFSGCFNLYKEHEGPLPVTSLHYTFYVMSIDIATMSIQLDPGWLTYGKESLEYGPWASTGGVGGMSLHFWKWGCPHFCSKTLLKNSFMYDSIAYNSWIKEVNHSYLMDLNGGKCLTTHHSLIWNSKFSKFIKRALGPHTAKVSRFA